MALSQNNSLTALAAVYARKVVQMAVQMDPNYWFESHIKSENNQIIETQNKTDAHREGGCPFLTQEKF